MPCVSPLSLEHLEASGNSGWGGGFGASGTLARGTLMRADSCSSPLTQGPSASVIT